MIKMWFYLCQLPTCPSWSAVSFHSRIYSGIHPRIHPKAFRDQRDRARSSNPAQGLNPPKKP